jgi:hypothetical protein
LLSGKEGTTISSTLLKRLPEATYLLDQLPQDADSENFCLR